MIVWHQTKDWSYFLYAKYVWENKNKGIFVCNLDLSSVTKYINWQYMAMSHQIFCFFLTSQEMTERYVRTMEEINSDRLCVFRESCVPGLYIVSTG